MSLIDRITVGDLEYLEDQGITLTELQSLEDGNGVTVTLLIHVLYVLKRHTHPNVTLDDIRALPVTSITDELGDALETGDASPEA
jgi:hypothetical protein|nr:MAG TPA: hypothetical protein [Caudoviricetes sp.]